MKFKSLVKIVAYAVELALIVSLIVCGNVAKKRKAKINALTADLKRSEIVIDSLNKRAAMLGNMDAIRVNTTFTVKNVNTLGIQKTGDVQQIAQSYAVYTRDYLLDSVINKESK